TVDATPSSRGREDGDEGVAATRCWVCCAALLRLISAPAMRCRLSNREMVGLFGITHRTCTMPGAMRIPSGCHVLIVSESEIGQRPVAAEGTVVVEYDVPRESCGSCIRIERRRHLSSPRVSVDAVLERDRRQFDVREHQVLAAVAEDD